MLTLVSLDKMENFSTLMRPFLVSYCTHSTTYIGCSGPVTGS